MRTRESDLRDIERVLHNYCRGLDRMDKELALSCWHPDGTDSHAPLYEGSAQGFIEWLWPVHAQMLTTHHMIGNIIIDLDGDRAGSETYWCATLRIPKDGKVFDYRGVGRYVDTFEYRDGRWAIVHRQSVRDCSRTDECEGVSTTGSQVSPQMPKAALNVPEVMSRRDKEDYSYKVLA
jgi:hypothetical protein